MCNYYNMERTGYTNCGTTYGCANYTRANTFSNGCGSQYMCRDGCGNVWVRTAMQCGCSGCYNNCWNSCCHNGCNNGCGGGVNQNTNGTATGNNGNGHFSCVTFCGDTLNGLLQTNNTATSTNTYSCGSRNRCARSGCGSWF